MNTNQGGAAGWRRTRRVAVAVWLSATGIQVIIWLLISIIEQRLAIPFWLWSGVAGGVIVGALFLVSRPKVAGGQR
jgi:hypothetical protein